MYKTTNPRVKGMQTPTATTTAGRENRQDVQKRYRIQGILWFIGLIIFTASCFVIHTHLSPYPIDLSATQTVQGLHMPQWLIDVVVFPSILDNPTPSYIATAAWFFGMLLIAGIFQLRHKPSAAYWLQTAVVFVVAIAASAAVNVGLDDIVGRPRPNPHTEPIHLYTPFIPFPTYPSGHVEHNVVYYGFLLYLSFTRPVRQWRYRWLLLPLQIFAVFDIATIGLSRVFEGDHWLTDVLGGYLEGLLLLSFFIFLYRWTTDWLARRRAEKANGQKEAALRYR
jgi:membrane-associated phospholipid phosphatase